MYMNDQMCTWPPEISMSFIYTYIWMFSDSWAAQDLFMQLLFLCKFVVIVVAKERTCLKKEVFNIPKDSNNASNELCATFPCFFQEIVV